MMYPRPPTIAEYRELAMTYGTAKRERQAFINAYLRAAEREVFNAGDLETWSWFVAIRSNWIPR